ncbi:class I SAM-dependent methyltransferase [Dokdonella sp. MW10]|uniref:class I SAM-dependent methyltransferase n=1 Tax=Dokdonella sp. MW10 TaxID=2992926 RepID=UPI003F8235F9
MKKLAFALAATLGLVACGEKAAEAPATPTATPAPAVSDQPEQVTPPASTADVFAGTLDTVLAGSWRTDENKARDAYRHPKETLAFFGVGAGQSVLEITPGGGWYTEILAPALKGNGTYTAAIAAPDTSDYAKRGAERFRAKLAGDAERYGDAKVVEFDPKNPELAVDAPVDVVLTFRNVHNWLGDDNDTPMFKAFFKALKPGGTLGVVEHRAAPGADIAAVKDSGYLPTEFVIKLATDAGFELVEQSEINANPKDTKDYEKGVWTLPPSYALKDVDREKYAAIGESDRMTLKFVKPQGDQIFGQGTDKGSSAP